MYEPPRFMSASDAANQLVQIIKRRENDGQPLKGTDITMFFKLYKHLQVLLQIQTVLVWQG